MEEQKQSESNKLSRDYLINKLGGPTILPRDRQNSGKIYMIHLTSENWTYISQTGLNIYDMHVTLKTNTNKRSVLIDAQELRSFNLCELKMVLA
jgi:hypothetical protein